MGGEAITPATRPGLTMTARVLSWAAAVSVVVLVGASALALGLTGQRDWVWLVLNTLGVVPALWAARRPSWASGLTLSSIGLLPLTYMIVGMLVLPFVLVPTLVLVAGRVRVALTTRNRVGG